MAAWLEGVVEAETLDARIHAEAAALVSARRPAGFAADPPPEP